ncbi:MAG: hypothetical protein CBB72_011385 [Muricauda sp. TMED12]|nr:MAG: hypothetical protein CBB72_011385 [Muricauda sp. TMED12]
MATVLRHKRNSSTGSTPTTSDLALGEIAINTYDGKLFIKKNDGSDSIVTFSPSTSAGSSSMFVSGATGTGSQAAFTLPKIPANEQSVFAIINGLVQDIDTYSISGNTLTFTTAPASADNIEFRVREDVATDVILQSHQRYIYTITTTTTSLSGNDDNGLSLLYTPGKVHVFQNGVKLIDGADFTATNGTYIALTTSAENGDVIEVESFGRASIVNNDVFSSTSTSLTTTSANQVVDYFPAATYRSAEYLVSASHGSAGYHTTKVLLMHDGTNTYISEYGTIYTNASLLSLSSDFTSGNVRLVCTPVNTNTTIKIQRQTVAV